MLTQYQAGLFSAVTSAFIVQVQPQLQPDPNEETAALLRILIYKIDNTTFGNDVPTVPQWSGPSQTIIQVQAILYASLSASLFSAFLAMLGKQWLNRYISIDVWGSAIKRSQNRQRKLNGIVTWYFNHVMESLPLMLQFALLLLGCALSLYLWGIDTTVALVVLGVTSFGVAFYGFIVIAGTVYVNCPYKTPAAHILCYIKHKLPVVLSILYSASSSIIKSSTFIDMLYVWWADLKGLECSVVTMLLILTLLSPILLPIGLAIDTYLLVGAVIRAIDAAAHRVCHQLCGAHKPHAQTPILDLQCITWMVQTSLDKAIHLLAMKLLTTMAIPANFNPTLISACFDILAGCVSIIGGKAVITQGSEELAEVSALYCLRTLSHFATRDPKLSTLKDVHQRYTSTFPVKTNFEGLPPDHSICTIHNIFHSSQPTIQWEDYKLPGNDQATLAHTLAKQALSLHQKKVPRWILRFALHHLSQDPLPPTSIVIDCLLIIAIDLGCIIPNTMTLERYVYI